MTKSLPRSGSTLVAAVVALLLAGTLAGCGGGSDDKSSDKSTDGSSSTSGSPTSSSSSGGSSGSSDGSSSSSDGQFGAEQGLSKDFPKDDVPLVSGKVVYSLAGDVNGNGGKGWTVRVATSSSPTTAIGSAVSKLKSAGFSQQGKTTTAKKGGAASLKNGDYDVDLVSASPSGKNAVVIYTVVRH